MEGETWLIAAPSAVFDAKTPFGTTAPLMNMA